MSSCFATSPSRECCFQAAGATRSSLHSHAETLRQIWELLAGHDPDDPVPLRDYWRELVASLPTEPARS